MFFSYQSWSEEVKYRGNGCKQGSVEIIKDLKIGPNTIIIRFKDYSVNKSKLQTKRKIFRKSCNFIIPVNGLKGHQIKLSRISVTKRGNLNLFPGQEVTIGSSLFLPGKKGSGHREKILGPNNRDFSYKQSVIANDEFLSNCGQGMLLRLNTSFVVRANKGDKKKFNMNMRELALNGRLSKIKCGTN